MTISPQEQDRRTEVLRQARHSTELEGSSTDAPARDIQDAWTRGELDDAEAIARTRLLCGLPADDDPAPGQR